MENKKPLILVSNDDGVSAKGINELIRFLRPLGDLVVMAPDSARSGSGSALTVNAPVHYRLVHQEEGLTVYQCSGTPTDCVKLARNAVLSREPDLVVAGINHGDNSAVNVHYSGTMGVVIEGCLNGVPSIGFSLDSHDPEADFTPCEPFVQEIVRKVLDAGLPPLTCLNVNMPAVPKIRGVRVCAQAQGNWVREWECCPRADGTPYYWLTGEFVNHDPEDDTRDHWAIRQGYIAVTPTTVDMTAYDAMRRIGDLLSTDQQEGAQGK